MLNHVHVVHVFFVQILGKKPPFLFFLLMVPHVELTSQKFASGLDQAQRLGEFLLQSVQLSLLTPAMRSLERLSWDETV